MLCCLRTDSKTTSFQKVLFSSVFPVWLWQMITFLPKKNWRTLGCLAGCLLTDWRFGLDPRNFQTRGFAVPFCGKAVAVAVVWPVWRSTWLPAWHGS